MENGDSRACKVIKYSEIAKNFICIKYGLEKLYRPITSSLIKETETKIIMEIEAGIDNYNNLKTFIIEINKRDNICKEILEEK